MLHVYYVLSNQSAGEKISLVRTPLAQETTTRNSPGDEIVNVNFFYHDAFNHFYAVHPGATEFGEIKQNKGHYAIQGHQFWYQLKAHIRFPVSD